MDGCDGYFTFNTPNNALKKRDAAQYLRKIMEYFSQKIAKLVNTLLVSIV
jgi:hypothetical protein